MEKFLIIVVGETDKKFFENYYHHLFHENAPTGSIIHPGKDDETGGYTKLRKEDAINAMRQNTDAGGKNLVIFDADDNFDSRRKELLAIKDEFGVEFELFLLPNNKDAGELEDMLEQIINPNNQPVMDCWAGKTEEDTRWDDSYWPLDHFTANDPTWASRFHVWRMDWDNEFIRLYLDDELLNEIPLSKTINGKGGSPGINPFHRPFYLLINLALDTRVTSYDPAIFPIRYEIDYVRIYHRKQ